MDAEIKVKDDTEQALSCRLACAQLERIVADVRTLRGEGRALLVATTEASAGELYRKLRQLGREPESVAKLDQVAMARRRVDHLDDEVVRAIARHRQEIIRRGIRSSLMGLSAEPA
ncbi:hypothetical protein DyAD56_16270 [Dyella sp. AD56]|uniref:hypothetical protein n=1 Tax=Dyella sp. AD56 TaxID=1528744 RepID=UPI000C85551E|nr:hypothetical protein [Dyella sp. AD56]PMQ04244.1 hypothetical protein DyAD56_16270 [Dyella sp. AD56]